MCPTASFWPLVVSSFNYFKMPAWSTSMLYLLHSSCMLSVVKMLLKGEVGGSALNSHENYIVDHGKSWKNHGIVFLNFCGNPGFIHDGTLHIPVISKLYISVPENINVSSIQC